MKSIISGDSGSRFILASFLLRDSKTKEAVTVFEGIRASEALGIPESSSFVDDLITHNNLAEARDVWSRLRTDGEKPALLNNPSFEKDIDQRWRQFDWVFRDSKYARITIDNAEAHSGRQSLRIDFAGLDTTNLDQEIGQLVVLLPGRHYRLECFAKTRGLITTEYPVMVITDRSFKWVAASRSIGADINDWQHLIIDFVTPSASGEVPLYVSIKRKPRFSFDEPTKGTIWLDDFALVETGQ